VSTPLVAIREVLTLEAARLSLLPGLGRALVLDTEFMTTPGSGRRIFAVGLGHVREGHCAPLVLFPDSAAPVVGIGRSLLDRVLAERRPVLTWCGTTADLAPAECLIPGLDWERWRLAARALHIDLHRIVRRSVRLDVRRYGLKDVAAALGIPRASRGSGWMAPRLYVRSCRAAFPEQTWERRALRRYLVDDVRLTYEVARELAARLDDKSEVEPDAR
jgi:hypothetical protein